MIAASKRPNPSGIGRPDARLFLLIAGALGTASVALVSQRAALNAAAATWSPFALVTGLLLIGVVANDGGVFASTADLIARTRGSEMALFFAAMALVAATTVVLNLDTSVAFLTPVMVHVARRRGANELRFLYGCVFMSNAASLLLPGSNLTNLLILGSQPVSGAAFLARMVLPWSAAVAVTAVVVAVMFRGSAATRGLDEAAAPRPTLLSVAAVLSAVVLILVLADAPLPLLCLGLFVSGIQLVRHRLSLRRIHGSVDSLSLAAIFLVAVALGGLARLWTFPAEVMTHAGTVASAIAGVVASVLVNNLPAAVLLGSRTPAHARSLLIGLNIGPNLAVTGSLSALIWWRAARAAGARPSALRYTLIGAFLVPLSITAALLAAQVNV